MEAEKSIIFLVESGVRKMIQKENRGAGIHLLVYSRHKYSVSASMSQALPWDRQSPCPC